MSTGLPIPALAPTTPPVASNAGANSPAQPGSADFLVMLSQLLGQSTPIPGVMSEAAKFDALAQKDSDEVIADECAGLAALFAFLPVPPATPLPTAAGGNATLSANISDILNGSSGIAGGLASTSVDAELLAQLSEADMATVEAADPGAAQFAAVLDSAVPRASANQPELALSRPVHAPVGTPAWSEEIGARLTMMAESGKQTASLRLSPEHLGPLEVRISVSDGGTSVWFGAAHADTRAAIEQALPRLREMFESQGMSLSDAGVFREPPHQQQPTDAPGGGADVDPNEERVVTAIANARLGLVDAYA